VLTVIVEFDAEYPWRRDALCREPAYSDVTWFPTRGEDAEPARAVCQRCAVQEECAAFMGALGGRLEGVWAGTSGRDRRRTRHDPRAEPGAVAA
jgi:WhiB family redox-sensing transcriptional regulator